jgi:DNA-binding MarR family transcriptional regulator
MAAGRTGAAVTGQPHDDQVEEELLDAVVELIGRVVALGESIAQRLSLPGPFIKALHILEHPMAMKDLGKKMHCDPSFVTVIADMLEKRGLARREAHTGDRRVKNIVLTDEGLELKHRIEHEMAARMPWSSALTFEERVELLRLIRKMLRADSPPGDTAASPPEKTSSLGVPAPAG